MPVNPIRSKRLLPLAILALLGAIARPASADTTMAECLSANEKAIKLRGDHALRQARDQTLLCAASSCPEDVRDACQRRVTQLTAAIPTVVFLAKDEAGNDLVPVRVSMDGEPIGERLDGTPIPIDPGQHTFTFKVADRPTVEKSLVISEGQKDRRETVVFGAATGALTSPKPDTSPIESVPAAASSRGRDQRVAGIVVGAVGVLGLGLGAVSGGVASSDWSSAKETCNGRPVSCTTDPNSAGFQEERSASTMAAVSTVGFIAGGVLVAGGLVVFLTAPKNSSSPAPVSARGIEIVPTGGPSGTGMILRGWF